MPSISRGEIRTRVRRRLEDVSSVNPHWSNDELNDYINESIRDFWDEVYTRNRYVLPVTTLDDYTWPANQVSANLTTLVSAKAGHGLGKEFDIYLISQYVDSDNTFDSSNPTNYPVPLTRTNYEELYRHNVYSSRFYDDFQFSNNSGNDGGAPGGSYQAGVFRSSTSRGMFRWAIQSSDDNDGINLFMSPVPANQIRLRIQVLLPFSSLDQDSDIVLNNEFDRFVDLIEYNTVIKAKGRSDEATDPVVQAYLRRLDYLHQWLASRSKTGYTRVVTDGY